MSLSIVGSIYIYIYIYIIRIFVYLYICLFVYRLIILFISIYWSIDSWLCGGPATCAASMRRLYIYIYTHMYIYIYIHTYSPSSSRRRRIRPALLMRRTNAIYMRNLLGWLETRLARITLSHLKPYQTSLSFIVVHVI